VTARAYDKGIMYRNLAAGAVVALAFGILWGIVKMRWVYAVFHNVWYVALHS